MTNNETPHCGKSSTPDADNSVGGIAYGNKLHPIHKAAPHYTSTITHKDITFTKHPCFIEVASTNNTQNSYMTLSVRSIDTIHTYMTQCVRPIDTIHTYMTQYVRPIDTIHTYMMQCVRPIDTIHTYMTSFVRPIDIIHTYMISNAGTMSVNHDFGMSNAKPIKNISFLIQLITTTYKIKQSFKQ